MIEAVVPPPKETGEARQLSFAFCFQKAKKSLLPLQKTFLAGAAGAQYNQLQINRMIIDNLAEK